MSISVSRLPATVRAFYFIKYLGRRAVDELDGVLGKAEQYFGRPATAAGLAIIFLGMIAAASRSIWTNVVKPIYDMYTTTGISSLMVYQAVSWLLLLGLFIFVTGSFIRDRKEAQALKATKDTLDRAERLHDDVKENHTTAIQARKEVEETLAAAHLLVEAAAMIVREQGGANGQDIADQILSLLNTESRTQP